MPTGFRSRLAALFVVMATIATISPWSIRPASAADTDIKINEVESNGGTPGDWVELHNTGSSAVNIGGFKFRDNDTGHAQYTIPAGTMIPAGGFYVLEEAAFGFGLGTPDSATLWAANGTTILDTFGWTPHATTTYGRCPDGTGSFITSAASTKGAANCPSATSAVKINEVESNGGTPGDWVELYNTGTGPVAIGGLKFRDNDTGHAQYTIPAGTMIPAGGFYLLEEAAFGFGLGTPDSATLWASDGTTILDTYGWTPHATTTYGRCPDGSGALVTTASSTKGALNDCSVVVTTTTAPSGGLAWPGDAAVAAADTASALGGNLSGLVYEGSGTSAPGVIWGAQNGPGSLFRLVKSGSVWGHDTSNGWSAGKALRYPGGTGAPDAEGVTMGGPTSVTSGGVGGLYAAVERNNSANSVSRNSILQFDISGAGTTLAAVREWDLTASLPAAPSANQGLEAITWIPDSFLTAQNFKDDTLNHTYNPADYPNHGTGRFFVGMETSQTIFAYALDHAGGGFARVATATGTLTGTLPGIMDLQFDRDLHELWSMCDDGCDGRSNLLRVNTSTGKFTVAFTYNRPAGMTNLNNEGFAIAPVAECVADRKPVFWSDDSATGGNALRSGNLPCTALAGDPPPAVPEFPAVAATVALAGIVIGGTMLRHRRGLRLAA